MESLTDLTISFKVNNDIINITLQPLEIDLFNKLKNDDAYSIQYVKLLIRNGLFVLSGNDQEIKEIYRMNGEEEELIYHVNVHNLTWTNAEQLAECNKENDVTNYSKSQDCSEKSTDHWTDSATSFILDKYETYLLDIGPMKKFKTKKVMWTQISVDMMKMLNIFKTPLQIENRYKTVLKRKKKAVENNSRSGSSREEIPFEKELHKIARADDSIEPEVLRSARSVKYPKLNVPENPEKICNTNISKHAIDGSPKAKKSKRSNEDIRMEFFEKKEAAKEKRHQEKLNLIRELFAKPNTE
ncbi:uncharacterized protein LOC105839029 [Monomorium pharaonis]|uniref:uncharacterized protein LOC105839029 n=1 Tax=Monomorium pharaonis TaxID=307658 RepID=UPI00063EF0E3|nr:uncharacterized protein LOC105839029 [Monomorium pharaonis]